MSCCTRSYFYEPLFQISTKSDKNYRNYSIFSYLAGWLDGGRLVGMVCIVEFSGNVL